MIANLNLTLLSATSLSSRCEKQVRQQIVSDNEMMLDCGCHKHMLIATTFTWFVRPKCSPNKTAKEVPNRCDQTSEAPTRCDVGCAEEVRRASLINWGPHQEDVARRGCAPDWGVSPGQPVATATQKVTVLSASGLKPVVTLPHRR